MRGLKIEDVKIGVIVKHKFEDDIKTITKIKGNRVFFDDEGVDYIIVDEAVMPDYIIYGYAGVKKELVIDDLKPGILVEEKGSGRVRKIIGVSVESNGTYNQISDDASAIIATLGTDEYAYFFSQIANKLARIKHGYSVEDSLLDIAGYAKLELDKFRGGEDEQSND